MVIFKEDKLSIDIKQQMQYRSKEDERIPTNSESVLHSNVREVLRKVISSMMQEVQDLDSDREKVLLYVKMGHKPKLSQIQKMKSKNVRKN